MKTLKLDHDLAGLVLKGVKRTTFRIYDDKDLSVNDEVELIDKVVADNPATWKAIGSAHINEVIQKRLGDLNGSDFDGHERYKSKGDMITTLRRFYGDQVSADTPVKILKFDFVSIPNKKIHNVVSKSTSLTEAKLYTDGGSRGNPGPSASGFVLMDASDTIVVKKGIYLGRGTNNQAEYQSLKFGLKKAHELGVKRIHIYMDSQLVIRQMQGIYKVKNKDLFPIYAEIRELAGRLEQVTFKHIPRELNKLADAEVNAALDANV